MEVIVEAIALKGFPQSCQTYISSGLRTATYKVTIAVDGKDLLTCDFSGKGMPINKPKKIKAGEERRSDEYLGNKFACKILEKSSVNVKIECKHGNLNTPHEVSALEINQVGTNIKLNTESALEFNYTLKNKKKSGTLTLKVTRASTTAELTLFKMPITETKCLYTVSDLEGFGIVSQVLKGDGALNCPEWVNFLGSMGKLLKIAAPVAEVDPHAKIALSAAEVAFELFMKQKDRDEKVLGLIEVMGSTYQMILDSNPLQKCRTLSQSINDLIALTRECSYFVAEYIKIGPFGQRAVINAFSNADDFISQFEKKFKTLKESFFTGIILSIGQITMQILDKLEAVDAKLNQIFGIVTFPVVGRSWSRFDGCVEHIQEPILSKIYTWGSSSNHNVPNIFVLTGDSKLGKSSISHTVAKYFYDCGRLGATVFFDSENLQSSTNFFSSIIRELSAYHPAIHTTVMTGLMSSNVKFINDPLEMQLHFLVSKIFRKLTVVGPLVIVVDGLDKCVDWNSLLSLLLEFPSNIRVMVTFAQSSDLISAFPERTYLLHEMSTAEDDDTLAANVYTSLYVTFLENSRPNVFANHTSRRIAKELHSKCNGDSSLAQTAIEFISVATDGVALRYLDLIIAAAFPNGTSDAKLMFQTALISCLDMLPYSATASILKRQRKEVKTSSHPLLDLQSFEFASTGMISHTFSMAIYVYMISTHNIKCEPPSQCHSVGFLSAIKADMKLSNINGPANLSRALNCILTCKCSHPPEAMKEENKALLEYLLGAHQADCIHKESPNEASDVEEIQDVQRAAILRHHTLLNEYDVWRFWAPEAFSGIVYLTPPVQHSGLSTSADKITLCTIYLKVYSYDNVHVEAAIYRAVTEKGKDTLAKMQIKLEETERAIEPYNENMNAADVEVVRNPLNGKGSWFVKNVPQFANCEALWFNCPIPTSRVIQNFSENDATDGQGIGFVNSLLPGDRIAIVAKSRVEFNRVWNKLTLFTDPKEKCPPANYLSS